MIFPTFFSLNLNFPVRSSCYEPQSALGLVFCWLYRASSAEKNIINLISVLTIWWYPRIKSSMLLLEMGVCYDQHALLTKLCYPFPCFILHLKAKCYPMYLLPSYFCILILHGENDLFFGVNSRKSYRSSENQSISLSSIVWPYTWITGMLNGLP